MDSGKAIRVNLIIDEGVYMASKPILSEFNLTRSDFCTLCLRWLCDMPEEDRKASLSIIGRMAMRKMGHYYENKMKGLQ